MRSLAAKTPFTLAAVELVGFHLTSLQLDAADAALSVHMYILQAATISEVTYLIKSQRQDYVQPGVVEVCKTHNVRIHRHAHTDYFLAGHLTQNQQDAIESQVGGSLKQCQENVQRLQGLIKGPGGIQSGINTATIAHRQGVVRSSFCFCSLADSMLLVLVWPPLLCIALSK